MDRLIDQILDLENLRLAWEEVAEKRGAPGIDRLSLKRWRRNWEERLVELAAAVRQNTYQPGGLRRFSIPKKDGSLRPLAILTVTDRVLQRAVLRVVDDRFDRDFLPCSFGYRPGRGVRDAIPAILAERDAGRQWVLDADIDACFDSLDHDLLRQCFTKKVSDPIVRRLFDQWLQAFRRDPERAVGVPMGGVISPLCCNILLHYMDQSLIQAGFHPIRYADDFCIFCQTEDQALASWSMTDALLEVLRLRLEPAKTAITHFERGFDFLGVYFYRNTYAFTSQMKRIEVSGAFDPLLFHDYVPEGYQ